MVRVPPSKPHPLSNDFNSWSSWSRHENRRQNLKHVYSNRPLSKVAFKQHRPYRLALPKSRMLVGVFGVTLSGLNGNKPQAVYGALIFLFVNAFSLAGLYKR